MLVRYQQLARLLLNDATFARCNDFDLRDFINIGRRQIAASGDVLRAYGVLEVDENNQNYPFKAIRFPGDEPGDGIGGIFSINNMLWQVGEGHKRINAWAWNRFLNFELAQPVPKRGEPRVWAQYGQGTTGSIFINKLDHPYRLTVDARAFPVDLIDDDTPEALPGEWTDAVPFFAAFYYHAGPGQNPQAAAGMMQAYQSFLQMARGAATPSTQSSDFPGGPDPYMAGRLGVGPGGQRGAQPRQQTPPTAM